MRVLRTEEFVAEKKRSESGEYQRVGTVDILDYIRTVHPNVELHLILGGDTFNDLVNGKWKEAKRLVMMTVDIRHCNLIGIILSEFLRRHTLTSFLARGCHWTAILGTKLKYTPSNHSQRFLARKSERT